MDVEKQKAVIDKLSAKKDTAFYLRYSENNRRWFIWKIIQHLLSKNRPESQIEQETLDIIKKATAAVKTRLKKGFNTGNLKSMWAVYNDITSRMQIIYGAIAMHPEFLEPANSAYLDFIVERRFRMVKRLVYFVNPNEVRDIFTYPSDDCQAVSNGKSYNIITVNKDASPYWITGNPQGAKAPPYLLNATGKADPVNAIELIFKANKDCERNIFPCDPVATILHMDSLQEAKNKKQLLDKMVGEGDHYLKIDHPFAHYGNHKGGNHLISSLKENANSGNNMEVKVTNIWVFGLQDKVDPDTNVATDQYYPLNVKCLVIQGNNHEEIEITAGNPAQEKVRIKKLVSSYNKGAKIYLYNFKPPAYVMPPYHFLGDSRPDKALFEQVSLSLLDLQVGDHIYVRNHPLYQLWSPQGYWGGEHSFVTELSSRKIGSPVFDSRFKVAGHGLRNTILGMAEDMINIVNYVIDSVQAVTKQHLEYWKQHGINSTADVTVVDRTINSVNYKAFEYNRTFQSIDWDTGAPKIYTQGFVVMQETVDSQEFFIWNFEDKDSSKDTRLWVGPIQFYSYYYGDTFNQNTRYKPENRALKYFDSTKGKWEYLRLFNVAGNGKIVPSLLTFQDLKKSSPFYKLDKDSDLFVTRPRVSFEAGYKNFLTTNGAI